MVGGQVVDEHGAPVRGAVVTLLDSAFVGVDSAASDSTGAFYLAARKPGGYLLRVAAPGLAPVESRAFRLEGSEFHQERIKLAVAAGAPDARIYTDVEVEELAEALPGNQAPAYPLALRNQGIEGEVVVRFVVDSTGRPLLATVKVLRSTREEFSEAVLRALPSFRFTPARIGGRPVAQRVQVPFTFSIY